MEVYSSHFDFLLLFYSKKALNSRWLISGSFERVKQELSYNNLFSFPFLSSESSLIQLKIFPDFLFCLNSFYICICFK